jgi:hypothetical protein
MLAAVLFYGLITPAPTEASVTFVGDAMVQGEQAGRTYRSQYAPPYRAQVTDDAVTAMSHAFNQYGASPLRAEIVQTRKSGEQTFYVVKIPLPVRRRHHPAVRL